jgi:hypothetical protein
VPVSYPDLANDVSGLLEGMLGEGIYDEVTNAYLENLRKYQSKEEYAPGRATPKYLRIVVSPDEHQQSRLAGEPRGDVATLKWDAVEKCIGSASNVIRTYIQPILQ